LFACFVGTTSSSDFPAAYMSAVPPWAFADRSDSLESETAGISRFSRLEFSDMHRFSDSAVPLGHSPWNAIARVAFPQTLQGRRTKRMISELNGWPACTSGRCYTRDVTIPSVRFEAAVVGYAFCVGLFHSQLQAGSSRRFQCPLFLSFHSQLQAGSSRRFQCPLFLPLFLPTTS